jgi:hypothetical protein
MAENPNLYRNGDKNQPYTFQSGHAGDPWNGTEKARQDQLYASNERRSGNMGSTSDKPITVTGTAEEQASALEGLERGQMYYGQTQQQTGMDVADIAKRRREMLEGTSPEQSRLRESRNRRVMQAKAAGANPEQIKQIQREAESDIANSDYTQGQNNLDKYQKMVGNILGGQMGLEMGFRQLGKSGEVIQPPTQSGGITVICSELYRQGKLSDEIIQSDREFGFMVRRYDPAVYIGYMILATPLVGLMRKSKIVSFIVSIPALSWAKWMHSGNGFFGRTIHFFGSNFCRFIGNIVTNGRYANER